jgi:hypothetical protein
MYKRNIWSSPNIYCLSHRTIITIYKGYNRLCPREHLVLADQLQQAACGIANQAESRQVAER